MEENYAEHMGAFFESLSWRPYRKKCKHCGKFNRYHLQFTEISMDTKLMMKALWDALEFANKRYLELRDEHESSKKHLR